MTFHPADLLLAWALDAALGDPPWIPWPHPVVIMGQGCSALERRLRRSRDSATVAILKGGIVWIAVVVGSFAASVLLLSVLGRIHPLLQRVGAVYFSYACLATRVLDHEVRAVAMCVDKGRLEDARRQLSRIVGRDTDRLSPEEILRGSLETAAENSSDGVVAPLFYLVLGGALGLGPALGVAYKAVNTLDSMLGYRDERYEYFGKVSARFDDLANWVPARLTALLVVASAKLLGERPQAALAVSRRDGRLHKSPNSGYPEAAFAGALGVQLGGTNWYRGVARVSPRMGDAGSPVTGDAVRRGLRLLWGVSALALLGGALFLWAF